MNTISTLMLGLLERLAEMFPDTYQTRLDRYLSTKSITDTGQLEHYIKSYEYNKGNQL